MLDKLSAVACSGGLHDIPPLSLDGLQQVLRHLKVKDAHALVAEMWKFRREDLSTCLLQNFINSMLHSGDFEPTWRNNLFMMLPKAWDSARPNNRTPIAIWKVTYFKKNICILNGYEEDYVQC